MSQVQAVKAASNAAQATLTFTPANTTLGNTLLIFVFSTGSLTYTSTTDNIGGGTYNIRSATTGNCFVIDNLSCAANINSVVVTVNSSTDFLLGALIERNDITGFDQCVAQASGTATSTWSATSSGSLAQASEIGYGFAGNFNSGGVLTGAGSGWTAVSSASITSGVLDDSAGDSGFIEYQIFSVTSAVTATGAQTAAQGTGTRDIASFWKLAAAGLMGQQCL
jgi:hypothetical protein